MVLTVIQVVARGRILRAVIYDEFLRMRICSHWVPSSSCASALYGLETDKNVFVNSFKLWVVEPDIISDPDLLICGVFDASQILVVVTSANDLLYVGPEQNGLIPCQ